MDQLGRTSTALATNTVVTSAFGIAFWVAASHRYSPRQVGIDSALISAMLLISSFTELNLSTALPRLLPQVQRRRSRAVALCYLATGGAGAIVAVGFVFAISPELGNLHFISQDRGLALGLIVAVVVFNVFAVQDAVLVATRWAGLVPIENAVFGVLKLLFMLALVGRVSGHGIFLSWVVGALLLVVPVSLFLFGKVLRTQSLAVPQSLYLSVDSRRSVVRYVVNDWLACMLGQGTADLLPLLVLVSLGRSTTGYFFIAFMIATAASTFAQSFSTALLVEGSYDEGALTSLTRRAACRCACVLLPGVTIAVIVAPYVLSVFGESYSQYGTGVLRLLLLAAVPQTVVALAMSVERVRGRANRVVKYQVISAGTAIGLAIPLMQAIGLVGIGVAWLLSQCIVGLLVLPSMLDCLRGGRLPTAFESEVGR